MAAPVLRIQLGKQLCALQGRRYLATMDTPPPGPVETSIREKLVNRFQPTSITIVNESWKHRHHAAMQAIGGGDGQTHFSVRIVSDVFDGKSTIQRHRMVYTALSEELSQGLHALSLSTKTKTEMTLQES